MALAVLNPKPSLSKIQLKAYKDGTLNPICLKQGSPQKPSKLTRYNSNNNIPLDFIPGGAGNVK
jgi:hypothetical protein